MPPPGPSAAPVTVPALQEWRPGGRDFVLKLGAVQVQVDPRHAAQLADDARTFAEDLEALSGRKVVVRVTPPRPGNGGQLHVWNDSPSAATEEQEAGRLDMPLRAMSQKLWESPLTGGWDALAARAFSVGKEPQWKLLDGPTQNLAQGALAWSSSRERPDCHEAMLVDGDERTRWCGPKTEPQSVIIDLGRPADLGAVVLTWETAFASGFSVDASDDLRSWRTLHSTASGDGGLDVLPVSGRGRYLRVAMTERGTQFGYSLREVQAYARGALVPAQFGASVDPAIVLQQPGATASGTLTVTNASAKATDVI
ncbi:hypothetical protein E1287_24895 [Actinomadura sp. KC06]|uniref:discoidin domain-containing protein n=1 Tax=Actinomadura sp. KC06 TaxID=2530369 RepID=UPI00104C26A1|nr:discoidin domain-containing protein [Actinomadura sp. KC06]TDD31866.1 hypothetical protein E1287_24895 [Actinomadura sp. KC06]